MCHCKFAWLVLGLVLCGWGCQHRTETPSSTKTAKTAAEGKSEAVQKDAGQSKDVGRKIEPYPQVGTDRKKRSPDVPSQPQKQPTVSPVEPPAPLSIPKVALSEELKATCLLGVGDAFPIAQLPDLNGNLQTLKELFGSKLTVICFWTSGSTRRAELVGEAVLHDLTKEIAEPFGPRGVAVIGVNVGDTAERVRQLVERTKASITILMDADASLYAQLATERKMPRTFLLDKQGNILWFDIEYSRSARHELIQGIQAALSEMSKAGHE